MVSGHSQQYDRARAVGLYPLIHGFRRGRRWYTEIRHRHKKHFSVRLDGAEIIFVTEDVHSRWFFHHRYRPGEAHEPAVSRHVAALAKSARVFADVGAHIGYYSCVAARCKPALRVFAFEVNSRLIPIIERNFAANHMTRATVVNRPVSDGVREVFYRGDTTDPGLSIRGTRGAEDWETPLMVAHTISLDDFFAERGVFPDLIKVDVQGAEMQVLRGAKRIIEILHPTILVEIHPRLVSGFGARVEEIYKFLWEHGYRLFKCEPGARNGDGLSELTAPRDCAKETHMLMCVPEVPDR